MPPGSVVADIGTDHALLPIYLVRQGLATRVIAVENRPTTLEQARRSLERHQCSGPVDLRGGDGLGPIRREDRVDTVIIAGLGGRTICRILQGGRDKWDWFQRFILQPMQEAPLLRRWLFAHGLALKAEKLVREGERFYEIMEARQGRQEICDPLLFELGPCLARRKDPLLEPYIRQKIARCRAIAAALQKSGRPENRLKYEYYLQKELRLKEVLQSVGHSENRGCLS